MKQLKTFGLAAIAALSMMAFVGAGSASGTVLCTESKDPCPYGEDYAAGTTIHAVLEKGKEALLQLSSGFISEVSCASSTVQGKPKTQAVLAKQSREPSNP